MAFDGNMILLTVETNFSMIGTLCFMFVKKFILTKQNPLESGLRFLPLFYG